MLDGFRYLEERDASDKITRAGVVSKKSAFVSPDNAGIYDAIALDLRLLAEAATSLADDADLQQILTQAKSMYDDMRTNPNFGSTAARAAAEDALKQAQAAAASAASAKEYGDKAASVASAITAVEKYLKTIDALQKSTSDNATVATNKAQAAATSETNAATSAAAAKTSETAAASSASAVAASQTAAKTSETNAASSASAAAASQAAAKTSETNAASSASAAAASQAAAKTSETNAAEQAQAAAASADSASASATAASKSQTDAKASEINAQAYAEQLESVLTTLNTKDGRLIVGSATQPTNGSHWIEPISDKSWTLAASKIVASEEKPDDAHAVWIETLR